LTEKEAGRGKGTELCVFKGLISHVDLSLFHYIAHLDLWLLEVHLLLLINKTEVRSPLFFPLLVSLKVILSLQQLLLTFLLQGLNLLLVDSTEDLLQLQVNVQNAESRRDLGHFNEPHLVERQLRLPVLDHVLATELEQEHGVWLLSRVVQGVDGKHELVVTLGVGFQIIN
jgi:hypothetical protein